MSVLIKILPLILCICFLIGCNQVSNQTSNETVNPDSTVENTCQLTGTTPVPQENLSYEVAGTDIYYATLSSSSTHLTVNILTMSCSEMIFGNYYHIEKEVDGEFKKVEWKNEAIFTDIAYIITSEAPIEKTYNWEYFLGELEGGNYRIVTDFYRDGEKITAYFNFLVHSTPDMTPVHMTPDPTPDVTPVQMTPDPVPAPTSPAVFNTKNAEEISFFTHGGLSEEYKVPVEHFEEIVSWLNSITVDKEVGDELIPPGTGFYRVRIKYSNNSFFESGLDIAEIDGVTYYLNDNPKPDCFYEIIGADA